MKRAKEVRTYRPKTFKELQKVLNNVKDVITKYPPPQEKKKEVKDTPVDKGGITDKAFKKSF